MAIDISQLHPIVLRLSETLIWLDANGTFSATDNLIGGNCTLNIGWVDSVYASGTFLQ